MSASEQGFLEAIRAAPGDEVPRLVFADYLDDRGDPRARDWRLGVALRKVIAAPQEDGPRLAYAAVCDAYGDSARAEFIRVQCELARIERPVMRKVTGEDPSTIPDPLVVRHAELRSRERELFDGDLGFRLRDELPFLRHTVEPTTYHGRTDRCCLYTRGFVSHITLTLADWCGGPCRHLYVGGAGGRQLLLVPHPATCECRGTGRSSGHGPALVMATPLERVTLAGRRPRKTTGEPARSLAGRYYWYGHDDPHVLERDAHAIPMCLRVLLPDYAFAGVAFGFAAVDAALDALSDACLEFARRHQPPQEAAP